MIRIQEYDEQWPVKFEKEKIRILSKAKDWIIDLEHVGSTSVIGLSAKPTIDMCMVVESLILADNYIIEVMNNLGYEYLQKLEEMIPDRRYLQLLDSSGEHLFHVHIVVENSKRHNDYLLLRDYLRKHPDEAKAYAELKYQLSLSFRKDRVAYTDGKHEFINKLLNQANKWHKSNEKVC